MRKLAALLAISAATIFAAPLQAQQTPGSAPPATQLISAETKKLLEQSLKLQQSRVDELTTISSNARASAAQLEVNAKASDKAAQALQDQAKSFRDARDAAGDNETKKKLGEFADECDAYAKRDKHFVDELRDAAKGLTKQADTADKGIESHNKTIARIKIQLGK